MKLRSGKRKLVAGLLLGPVSTCAGREVPEAISVDGRVYVKLSTLLAPDLLRGSDTLENWGREIRVVTERGNFAFTNGGNEFIREGDTTRTLFSPVQVIDGLHYVPAEECSSLIGYNYRSSPSPAIHLGAAERSLKVQKISSRYFGRTVSNLKNDHRYFETTGPLEVRTNFHNVAAPVTLAAGQRLLLRRTVRIDGVPYGIITRDDATLASFAVPLGEINKLPELGTAAEEDGRLARLRRKQAYLTAQSDSSINHGPRGGEPRFALTIDLCWSLRPIEEEFFACAERLAESGKPIDLTLFVSGRWIEQHPEDMHRLIEMSRVPGIRLEWGLHSWDHPKEGAFMNTFSPEELWEDTVKLESALMNWGLVPSIFYRFPGLIHDTRRLCAILDFDLLSVDCDSWVNGMRAGTPPHRLPARSGSILLIHGNGNEPDGIPKLYDWLETRPHWKWAPVAELVTPD